MMVRKIFRKEERLCSKRSISDLFHNGSSFVLYPYRVVFLWKPRTPEDRRPMVRVLFSVSKRKFPKAVDRNLIKRRMRESYRLQKAGLISEIAATQGTGGQQLDIAVQYIAGESKDFYFLSTKMVEVLSKLRKDYAEVHLGEDR